MSKKVLVINYYRSKSEDASGVKEIVNTIKESGDKAKVIHHSEALRQVKNGKDILKEGGYTSFHASGSDLNWTEKTDKGGGKYLSPGPNILAKYLVTQDIPGEFDCGSGQAAYHALGQLQEEKGEATNYRVRNTGKFNKKIIDGYKHNNKYGMDAKDIKEGDLEGKIKNIVTHKHQKKNYISSFKYGNKKIMQYHQGRTEKGVEDLRQFHGLKYHKAA